MLRITTRLFLSVLVSSILLFPAQAAEAQLVKVKGVQPEVGVQFLPAYVAQAKGIFKDEGLEVELITVRGAKEGVQALVGGDVHFIMTIGPVLPAIWQGIDLKLLAQMVGMPTFSLIVRPEINKIEDLKGKKIGVSFGGMTLTLLHDLLKLNGLDPEKAVEYVNIPGSPPKIAALEKGVIAAALLSSPGDFEAIRVGFKRLVFLGDLMPDLPLIGLIVAARYMKENPKIVEKLVRAIVRAVYATRDDSETAISVMQSYLKMKPDEARDTYFLIRKSFSPVLTEAGLKRVAEMVSKSAGIRPTKEPKEYMDLGFLNQAVVELGRR